MLQLEVREGRERKKYCAEESSVSDRSCLVISPASEEVNERKHGGEGLLFER